MISRVYKDVDGKRSEAIFRLRNGKVERGRELADEARALFAAMPADDPKYGELSASMAELMLELNEPGEAERLIKQSLDLDFGLLSPNELGTREMFLAQLLKNQGRWDEAEEHVQRAIKAPFGEIGFAHEMLREILDAKQR